MPSNVLARHLLVTVGCKSHQQVGAHNSQPAANEGQDVAPWVVGEEEVITGFPVGVGLA